jgi:methionyl aminopeptidase
MGPKDWSLGLIELNSPKVIRRMRRAGELAAATLVEVGKQLRPGMRTDEINTLVHEMTLAQKGRPAPLNYKGFPKSVCTSLNEVICHGIPGARELKDGDILNVDVTTVFPAKGGYHGDTSATFYIGEPSEEARLVVETARVCLEVGLAEVRAGAHLSNIGAAIQEYAESKGCSVVRDFVGHGIGKGFHLEPSVPHFGSRGRGVKLKSGMVFTIEPMINLGDWRCRVLDDDWTAVTVDGKLSAQFEHTIVVTRDGCEVLTRRDAILVGSEDQDWAELGPLGSFLPA